MAGSTPSSSTWVGVNSSSSPSPRCTDTPTFRSPAIAATQQPCCSRCWCANSTRSPMRLTARHERILMEQSQAQRIPLLQMALDPPSVATLVAGMIALRSLLHHDRMLAVQSQLHCPYARQMMNLSRQILSCAGVLDRVEESDEDDLPVLQVLTAVEKAGMQWLITNTPEMFDGHRAPQIDPCDGGEQFTLGTAVPAPGSGGVQ